jgi:hypothetical protein
VLALRTWIWTHGASSRVHVSGHGFGSGSIGRIDEHGHPSGCGHQLTQEFQPLCRQLTNEEINPCQVAAWPREAGDKTKPHRVFGDGEDDGDRRGCRLGCKRSSASGRSDLAQAPL